MRFVNHCCGKVVYSNPFKVEIFSKRHDCAVLRADDWTTLPDEIQEMNALKALQVNNGILQQVPKVFDDTNFNKLVKLDLSTIYCSI